MSLKKTCEKSACSGTISNDSAGDTSQRCDKAPAHFVSGTGIKSPEQLLSRLSDKGLAANDVGVGTALLGTLGYTHVVRYVPAHVSIVERPSFSTLYRDINLDHAFQGALLTLRFLATWSCCTKRLDRRRKKCCHHGRHARTLKVKPHDSTMGETVEGGLKTHGNTCWHRVAS